MNSITNLCYDHLLLVKNPHYPTTQSLTDTYFDKIIIDILKNINAHYSKFYCRPKRGNFVQFFLIKIV